MEALEDSGATADEVRPVTEFVKNREQNTLSDMFLNILTISIERKDICSAIILIRKKKLA